MKRSKSKAAVKAKPANVAKVKSEDTAPLERKSGTKPYAIADREQARKLCSGLGAIMATWKEVAAVLDVSEATLMRMFHRWPDVKDAYDSGKQGGRVALRRHQFALAAKNATMAIFLGMNYLDQKDHRNVQHGGKVAHDHQHSIVGMMLKEIDDEARGRPVIEHHPAKKGEAA